MISMRQTTQLGWQQYVNLDLSPLLRSTLSVAGKNADQAMITSSDRVMIEQALTEMWATDEGRQHIINAASTSPDGKITFMSNGNDNQSAALRLITGDPIIAIGQLDGQSEYIAPDGSSQRFSMQHVLFHELCHLQPDQFAHRTDEDVSGVSLSKELEAIRVTNNYMSMYYGDPPRPEADNGTRNVGDRARNFLSPNFKPDGYTSTFQDAAREITERNFTKANTSPLAGWQPIRGNG